jgi:hypothetical protein
MSLARIVFHVQDPSARPIGGALLDAASMHGPWQGTTDETGEFVANLAPGHYDIKITAPGFMTRNLPADLADPGTVTIGLDFAAGSLLAVRAGARDFATSDGRRHVIIGSTELMLGWRFDREGAEAIRPVLMQRQLCGFNNLRVLWQKGPGSNGLTVPWVMPVAKLRPFLALCAEYLFYVEGVILADCPSINPNESDQKARVKAVRDATVGITNHIEQLGNEWEKNGHDPRHFTKPTDRMAANSSSIEGGTDAPYWDFFCFSGQRSPLNHAIREYGPLEFIYAEGGPGWGGVPAICDEGFKPGAGSVDPRDWERAGAQARSGCGGRFHSDAGTAGNCRLFNDLELDCAKAFTKGLGTV